MEVNFKCRLLGLSLSPCFGRSCLHVAVALARLLQCAVEHRIYSIVSRGLQSFFHQFMQLTIKCGLHFLFFTLLKSIDDAQSFLGYVLSNKFFFRIRFSSASRAYPSQEGL